MARAALRSEEGIGLVVAAAAHAALVALLVLRPATPPVVPLPERMTVTLSDDVGLTSTSPEPAAQAAPDEAPTLDEPAAAAPEPAPRPEPAPKPVAKVEPVRQPEPPKPVPPRAVPPKPVQSRPLPPPRPVPAPRPAQRPVARPVPMPPKVADKARPTPTTPARPTVRPNAAPAARPATRPATAPRGTAATPPRTQAGGSRIGNDFLKGVQGAQATGTSRTAPAATIGPAVRSALSGAISRQLKPRWVAPQGAEAELLVTVLTWNLNADGTLAGTPRVVRQSGITDANRAQAQRHAEQAIRAVQLAAPFTLPTEYYDAWKRVAEFRFDRKLSQ